jgi:phytoene dehydrogenase-like protein
METTTYDVIVIGAGLAGLVAAQQATRSGARVLVLDGQPPGGRARTDERDGYLFNRGPHALYLGGHAQRVLESFGVDIAGGPPDANVFGSRGGEIAPLPAGALALATSKLLGFRGKLAIGSLLSRLAKIPAQDLAAVSVRGWLDTLKIPPDAEALLLSLVRVTTYANAPDDLSAEVAVGQMQHALGRGVRYLHGGWQSMIDQLSRGLDIERASVSAVEPAVRSRLGVTVHLAGTDGDSARAARSVVIAVGSPHATAALLGRPDFDVGPPIEAACLDLGVRHAAKPAVLLGIDQPLYLSNHCPPARLAPAGRFVVHVARYLSAGDDLSPAAQREELERHAALAGVAADEPADVETSRYLHRMTVVSAMPTAALGGLRGRPGVATADSPDVLLAGDWVGSQGHLADASLASGAHAGAMAAQRARELV